MEIGDTTTDPAEQDLIVLVNEQGEPIGSAPKLASHHANTPLHLAFSVYIFRGDGKILVTQRAHSKKVWPNVWTNSCCGHPAPAETMENAITRRVLYELGMHVSNLRCMLPNYRYKTPPNNGIIEHEICPLFFAKTDVEPRPNPLEVDAFEWLTWEDFTSRALADVADTWSWWCKDQIKQLQAMPDIRSYLLS